jgi:hypothetical protein
MGSILEDVVDPTKKSPAIEQVKDNANRSSNSTSNMHTNYGIPDILMGTKRTVKIIFMGMGCSGINFAHQLFQKMEKVELTIYEKNVSISILEKKSCRP